MNEKCKSEPNPPSLSSSLSYTSTQASLTSSSELEDKVSKFGSDIMETILFKRTPSSHEGLPDYDISGKFLIDLNPQL